MKLVVYGNEPSKEKVLRLALKEYDMGGATEIDLLVVDEYGTPVPNGRLIRIFPNGTMRKFLGVSPSLGFQSDEKGYVKFV